MAPLVYQEQALIILDKVFEPYSWRVILCNDSASYLRAVKRHMNRSPDVRGANAMCSTSRHKHMSIIGMFKTGNVASLVHEITHLSIEAFTEIGAEISEHTHEPFAYWMSHVFEECNNALHEKGIKR